MYIKKEEAFTLIEVMLSIVLITLILGVLFNLNLSSWRFWKFNQDSVELSQLTTLISTNLDRKIRSQDIDNIKVVNNYLELDNGDYIIKVKDNDLIIDDNGNEKIIIQDAVKNYNFTLVYVDSTGSEPEGNHISELESEIETNFDKNNVVVGYEIILENKNKTLDVSKRVKPRL